jgi:hypothetical protein
MDRKRNREEEWRPEPGAIASEDVRPVFRSGKDWILPKLKVQVSPDGRLKPAPRPAFGPLDTSEAWWQAVLTDARVNPRNPRYRFDTLGMYTLPTLALVCGECGVQREFLTAELLREFGREYFMTYLRYELASCPKGRSFRACAVRWTQA